MSDRADVVISWNMGTVPASMRANFTRPTRFIDLDVPAGRKYMEQLAQYGWPFPVRNLISRRLGASFKPLRVATMGFSESCTGVRGLLQSKDGLLLDTAIAIDGIHSQFDGGKPNKGRTNVGRVLLAPWFAFAKLAATGTNRAGNSPEIAGERHCIITHSAIVPPYVSTTETAREILNEVFGTSWPVPSLPDGLVGVVEQPPFVTPAGQLPGGGAKYPETTYTNAPDSYQAGQGGLVVMGFENQDPTGIGDHKYQAGPVMQRVVQRLLIDRWNAEDPTAGVCLSSAPSAGGEVLMCSAVNPAGVTVPEGAFASQDDFSTDWQAYLASGTKPPGPGDAPPVPPGPTEQIQGGGVSVAGALASIGLGALAGYLGAKTWQQYKQQQAR